MGDSGLRVWLSHASPPSSLPSLSNLPPPQPFLTFPSFRLLDILRSRFFDFFTFLFFFSLSFLLFLCNFLSYFFPDFYAILPPSTALYLLPPHASALLYRPFVLVYSPSFDFFTFLFFSTLFFFSIYIFFPRSPSSPTARYPLALHASTHPCRTVVSGYSPLDPVSFLFFFLYVIRFLANSFFTFSSKRLETFLRQPHSWMFCFNSLWLSHIVSQLLDLLLIPKHFLFFSLSFFSLFFFLSSTFISNNLIFLAITRFNSPLSPLRSRVSF